jgi:hypothetical protein
MSIQRSILPGDEIRRQASNHSVSSIKRILPKFEIDFRRGNVLTGIGSSYYKHIISEF